MRQDALQNTAGETISSASHRDAYRKARSRLLAAYMSNAKWRKVLSALATATLDVARTEWKLIDSDHVAQHRLPRPSDILSTHFADGEFQPFAYKWIEWIRFPRVYRVYAHLPYEKTQDVEAVAAVLATCGQLATEVDAHALTLLAYRRPLHPSPHIL